MRLVFRFIFYFLSIILLIQCERNEPNPQLTINDKNFLYALIALGIDTNGDGQISNAEAKTVISLDVSQNNISDMKGIEKFVNLDTLNCRDNDLTTLDISNLPDLWVLSCSGNQMSSLNISNNPDLGPFTGMTVLDISNMPSLHEVCVLTMPFPPEGVEIDPTGSPNVYFTIECSD
jgi:hypothetical protein